MSELLKKTILNILKRKIHTECLTHPDKDENNKRSSTMSENWFKSASTLTRRPSRLLPPLPPVQTPIYDHFTNVVLESVLYVARTETIRKQIRRSIGTETDIVLGNKHIPTVEGERIYLKSSMSHVCTVCGWEEVS